MLEDENHSEEEKSEAEEERKIEDNMLEDNEDSNSSNHLLDQPGIVIDNQEEPSGNTLENEGGVKMREIESNEEDDKMKKAKSEIGDNVDNVGESVNQNLGEIL